MVSHGLYSPSTFSIIHAGLGSTLIGAPLAPESSDIRGTEIDKELAPQTSHYLLQQVLDASALASKEISIAELVQAQFEKLVINAMINPLTVVFDCLNGELFEKPKSLQWMRLLLYEASSVLQSLPELNNIPDSKMRFSLERLERMVLDVANMTAENKSSMLQDVRAGRETEIDYINGYIVARGERLGLDCVQNRAIIKMVKDKLLCERSNCATYRPVHLSTALQSTTEGLPGGKPF